MEKLFIPTELCKLSSLISLVIRCFISVKEVLRNKKKKHSPWNLTKTCRYFFQILTQTYSSHHSDYNLLKLRKSEWCVENMVTDKISHTTCLLMLTASPTVFKVAPIKMPFRLIKVQLFFVFFPFFLQFYSLMSIQYDRVLWSHLICCPCRYNYIPAANHSCGLNKGYSDQNLDFEFWFSYSIHQ